MAADILTRVTTLNAMVSLLPAPSPSPPPPPLPSSCPIPYNERKVPSVKRVPTLVDAHNLLHATPDACRRVRHASLFLTALCLYLSTSSSLLLPPPPVFLCR